MTLRFNEWVTCPVPKPMAKSRLFCLPFAGGGALEYRQWGNRFAQHIEVCPIQLPGRENRYGEPNDADIRSLACQLKTVLDPFCDKPYAIYGHSMGALIAYELVREIEQSGLPTPRTLIAAAHRAPHLPPRRPPIYHLPDPQFIAKLKEYGGFSDAILESAEMMDFLLPVLRGDFKRCDQYQLPQPSKIKTSLQIMAGSHDPHVLVSDAQAWSELTTGQCAFNLYEGGHFFLRDQAANVIQAIERSMA